jgi:hypothetical protein
MAPSSGPSGVIPVSNLRSFFIDSVRAAIQNQRLDADASVVAYLGNMLHVYARSEHLYEQTEDGVVRRPLVELYRAALEAESARERRMVLQRLGDMALFVAGILPNSLERSLVDVDYYISMGSHAYGYLSDLRDADARSRSLAGIFEVLSRRFGRFVDVLNEVVESGPSPLDRDVLRLYEIWTKTRSLRLRRRLIELGVAPLEPRAAH